MQQHRTAAPGASAVTTPTDLDAIRATVVEHKRAAYGLAPTDGEAGGAGTVAAAPGAPTGGDPLGLAPAASTSDSAQSAPTVTVLRTDGQTGQAPAPAGQQQPAAAAPPAPQQAAAPVTAVPAPPPASQQQGQPATGADAIGAGPLANAPLESFPPEIRDYVASLRREAGENRVKAKTAEQVAAEQAAEVNKKFLDGILKAAGLIEDVDDQASQLTPEQRLEQATSQVGTITAERDQATTRATNAERELAIWQQAHDLGANPKRLTDSRTFMQGIGGLDPAADDYNTRLAAAIGAAVESDPYYRNAPVGQVPPVLPPAPSGGDFGGGPAQQSTALPTDVDGYRELLKQARANSR